MDTQIDQTAGEIGNMPVIASGAPTTNRDGGGVPRQGEGPVDCTKGLEMASVYGLVCGLPGCGKELGGLAGPKPRFCSKEHKNEYWFMCSKLGDQILSGKANTSGKSQTQQILAILQAKPNCWISMVAERLPHIRAFTRRISDLRRRGFIIETRERWEHHFEYRLVVPKAVEE